MHLIKSNYGGRQNLKYGYDHHNPTWNPATRTMKIILVEKTLKIIECMTKHLNGAILWYNITFLYLLMILGLMFWFLQNQIIFHTNNLS